MPTSSAILLQGHPKDERQFLKIGNKTVLEKTIENVWDIKWVDNVLLLIPDINESYDVYANLPIEKFYGSDNVFRRFQSAIETYKIDEIIRIPVVKPLIDMKLAHDMLTVLKSDSSLDNVSVPVDFPTYFSPEVFRKSIIPFIEKDKHLQTLSNPFNELYNDPSLNSVTLSDGLPYIDEEKRKIALELERQVLSAGGDVRVESSKQLEYQRYKFTINFIRGANKVLDVACGDGYGLKILSPYVNQIVGVDSQYHPAFNEMQENNIINYTMDVMDIEWKNEFDCIVSFETLEHLFEPERFLSILDLLPIKGYLHAKAFNRL